MSKRRRVATGLSLTLVLLASSSKPSQSSIYDSDCKAASQTKTTPASGNASRSEENVLGNQGNASGEPATQACRFEDSESPDPAAQQASNRVIRFAKRQIDRAFRSEGVAVADFNQDGQLDIVAGLQWYAAPDWEMHPLREEPVEHSIDAYSQSFVNAADDINADGWPDILIVGFPGTETCWYENPGAHGGTWARHLCVRISNNESPQYLDVDGDGQRDLLMAYDPQGTNPRSQERCFAYFTRPEDPNDLWDAHPISEAAAPGTAKFDHGLGLGDINGDGRNDIISAYGWWEGPEDVSSTERWGFHRSNLGRRDGAAQMYADDFDGDGDADIISSSPHRHGIWWHEQLADGEWERHLIDERFSQTHSLCMADINGDGQADFITGKRWRAHNGHDPGTEDPAVLTWYEYQSDPENGEVTWTPHQIDHDSGIGTQFEIVDVNGDGILDVVTSNKKGVFYFRQVAPE